MNKISFKIVDKMTIALLAGILIHHSKTIAELVLCWCIIALQLIGITAEIMINKNKNDK